MKGLRVGVPKGYFDAMIEPAVAELKARAMAADISLRDEGSTSCCYARSEKYWVTDPQGLAWEHFHTLGDIPVFHDEPAATAPRAQAPGKALGIAVKPAAACC